MTYLVANFSEFLVGCSDKDGNTYNVGQSWNPNPLFKCTCTPNLKVECQKTEYGCWDSHGNAFVDGHEWLSNSMTKCTCSYRNITVLVPSSLGQPAPMKKAWCGNMVHTGFQESVSIAHAWMVWSAVWSITWLFIMGSSKLRQLEDVCRVISQLTIFYQQGMGQSLLARVGFNNKWNVVVKVKHCNDDTWLFVIII